MERIYPTLKVLPWLPEAHDIISVLIELHLESERIGWATCRLGQYDVHALSRGLSAERKAKFFKPCHKPNMMQIDPRVKSMVEFRPMNLLGSYALMGKFDVIFCRNVLIYFSNEVKADILRKLTMCLNPGGYLILGSTETLVGVSDKYEMMRCNPGIIYRLKPQKYAFL